MRLDHGLHYIKEEAVCSYIWSHFRALIRVPLQEHSGQHPTVAWLAGPVAENQGTTSHARVAEVAQYVGTDQGTPLQ